MRKFLFIIFFTTTLFAQWEVLNVGPNGYPRDIDFVGDIGWIASDNSLLKTDDGGETWQELNLDWRLNSIDFITTQIGWASGYNSEWKDVILKTNDGGFNWDVKYQYNNGYAREIYALNEDTIFAVGSSILRTADGGKNWDIFTPDSQSVDFKSVIFFNRLEGIAAGSAYHSPGFSSVVFKTWDSGENWQELAIPGFRDIYEFQLVNDSIVFFTAESDTGWGTRLYKSNDMLQSWTEQRKFENFYFEISIPFHAVSVDTIVAVTSEYNDSTGATTSIQLSSNAGIDWEKLTELPSWGFNKILLEKNKGHLIGTVGVNGGITSAYGPIIYGSSDYGATWDIKKISYPFKDIFFIDENKGFATGGSDDLHFQTGELFTTDDGGNSWDISMVTDGRSGQIQFLDNQIGFLLVSLKGIFKTVDGGVSWTNIYPSSKVFDYYFISETHGWISRSITFNERQFAIIYSTTNGINWVEAHKVEQSSSHLGYESIFILNEQNGWAVGFGGLIAKLKDGVWSSMRPFTNLPLNKIFFANANNGWVSAGYDPKNQFLFSTENGGDSWDFVDFNYKIEDIFFQDENRGWIAGFDSLWRGAVLLTENGGQNWQVLIDSLRAPIHSLHFNHDQAWATGGQGLILHSDDGVNWIEEPKIIPITAKLHQNYPNPFNPKTTIGYEIPKTVKVNLSIYNILGQKISTLVSQKQTAGSHKVEWDASSFSSGVYFYRLKIGEGVEISKKLIVLN